MNPLKSLKEPAGTSHHLACSLLPRAPILPFFTTLLEVASKCYATIFHNRVDRCRWSDVPPPQGSEYIPRISLSPPSLGSIVLLPTVRSFFKATSLKTACATNLCHLRCRSKQQYEHFNSIFQGAMSQVIRHTLPTQLPESCANQQRIHYPGQFGSGKLFYLGQSLHERSSHLVSIHISPFSNTLCDRCRRDRPREAT